MASINTIISDKNICTRNIKIKSKAIPPTLIRWNKIIVKLNITNINNLSFRYKLNVLVLEDEQISYEYLV